MDTRLNEFEFVIRTIRQGIWRVDPYGRILWANPFLAQWLDSTPQRMCGRYESDFVIARLPAPDSEGSASGERFEAEFVTETGERRQGIVVSTPTSSEGPERRDRLEVITDITLEHAVQLKLMSDVRRMATLAGMDPLTHLLNRRGFEAHMESLQRHRGDVPFGLVCLDLNGLKVINDRFGHSVGDKALVLIAQRLRSATRSYDVMARLGGDEFCVLLPGASLVETSDVADRLRNAARGDIVHEGSHLAITTAVGWSHSSQSFDDIYRAADIMMYADKPAQSRFEA